MLLSNVVRYWSSSCIVHLISEMILGDKTATRDRDYEPIRSDFSP